MHFLNDSVFLDQIISSETNDVYVHWFQLPGDEF